MMAEYEKLNGIIKTVAENPKHHLPLKTEELYKLLEIPSQESVILEKINLLLEGCLSQDTANEISSEDLSTDFFQKLDGFYEKKEKNLGVKHVYNFLGNLVWKGGEKNLKKADNALAKTIKKDYDIWLLLPFCTITRPYASHLPNYKRILLQTIGKIKDLSSSEGTATLKRLLPEIKFLSPNSPDSDQNPV